MASAADRNEGEAAGRLVRDLIAARRAVRRLPRGPRRDGREVQRIRPPLVVGDGHAGVGLAVVDDDVELGGHERRVDLRALVLDVGVVADAAALLPGRALGAHVQRGDDGGRAEVGRQVVVVRARVAQAEALDHAREQRALGHGPRGRRARARHGLEALARAVGALAVHPGVEVVHVVRADLVARLARRGAALGRVGRPVAAGRVRGGHGLVADEAVAVVLRQREEVAVGRGAADADLVAQAAVAHEDPLEVDLAAARDDVVGEGGDVDARIALAGDPEVLRRVLRVRLEEDLEAREVVRRRRGVVVRRARGRVRVAEADAGGRLDEDLRAEEVPRVLVLLQRRAAGLGPQRAALLEGALKRGAAGPAVVPRDDGVGGRVALRREDEVAARGGAVGDG